MAKNKSEPAQSTNWYVLILASITFALGRMFQMAGMPVLFKEISGDLQLNLVQIGALWGMIPLGSLFASPIAGLLCDKFGIKKTTVIFCLLTGLTCAARGLSGNYIILILISFLAGMFSSMIGVSTQMAANLSSAKHQHGLAQGILMAFAGSASVVAAIISATIMSPLLGGWRNVMYIYGGIVIILALLWIITFHETDMVTQQKHTQSVSITGGLIKVFRMKTVLLLGLVGIAYFGCVQGISGYLVLYLLQNGWTEAASNGALAIAPAAGAIGAIPLTLFSDRIGSRKFVLLIGLSCVAAASLTMCFINNQLIWFLVILYGVYGHMFPAIMNTIIFEAQDVLPAYKGTGLAVQMAISQLGMFFAPPAGNSLAIYNEGLPFIFWGVMGLLGLIALFFLGETGWKAKKTVQI
jgi:MFS family permease